jgi:sorbitol/mannitol transport system permease protein
MTSALAPAPSKLAAERKKSSERGRRLGSRGGNIAAGIAAWAIGILFVFPVFFMVLTSLHSEVNASTNPPSFFAPLTLDGYREFFGASSGASPWPPLINSATASIISTILVILLAIPAAYALSVKPIKKWTDAMFFFLSTKMLPASSPPALPPLR